VLFSVWISAAGPWDDALAVGRHAEATGWDGLWLADHFMNNGDGPNDAPNHEAFALLAGLAAAVPRVRIGSLVAGNTYRHPAVLAKTATTIDHISGGRMVLGIGAGWQVNEHEAYGIPLGTVRERMAWFEEACQVLTSLLSQETTTFDGSYYQLKDARNEPKGPQQPHPPICIGGSGEKRTLRITAKYADHWNFVGGPPEEFARKRDVLASHCADLGRDPKEIMLSSHVRLGADRDYAKVVDEAAALGAEGLDLAIIYLPPPLDPAVLEPLAEAIRDSGQLTA